MSELPPPNDPGSERVVLALTVPRLVPGREVAAVGSRETWNFRLVAILISQTWVISRLCCVSAWLSLQRSVIPTFQ